MSHVPPPSTPTGAIPAVPAPEAEVPSRTLRRRMADAVADPVLRILLIATFLMTLGRGVFLTLTVLYFSLIVGLDPAQLAIVLTVASGVGAAGSLLGGMLADRISARRLFFWLEVVVGLALIGYAFSLDFVAVLLVAALFTGTRSAAQTVRSAIVARAFTGPSRVGARAAMRTVTNIGIAIGSSVAGITLLFPTALSFQITMVAAGALVTAGSIPLLRLPARVDASPAERRPEAGDRGRSPYRDGRYLLLTALSGLFTLNFALMEIGLPLWVLHSTEAPIATVSVILVLNTILVIGFQIPLSRGTHDILTAGRVTAIAGVLMGSACVIYALAAGVSPWGAVVLLLVAAVSHTFAEVLSSAGAWGLSFELADQRRAGAYQGVFNLGWSLGGIVAPVVITAAVTNGLAGWVTLGALFLLTALGIWLIARRAAATTAPQ